MCRLNSPAKQPLILVPGLVCDGAVWAHQRAGLADVARPDTMQTMATEVLGAAPERFAIAGFSMGGYVALEVLRQAPHRVTRLALIDTGARADSPEQIVNRKAAIADCRAGRYAAAIENMLPVLLHSTRLAEPLADQVRAMATRIGPASWRAGRWVSALHASTYPPRRGAQLKPPYLSRSI